MSVNPTRLLRAWRAALLVAVAAALIAPAGALAKPGNGHGKAVGQSENDPAVCERDAKANKNGKVAPGQAKKTEDAKPCSKDEKGPAPDSPAAEQKQQPAPAPAPVAQSAPSVSPQVVVARPCTSKRYFRITLGKRNNVKRARVLLNGKRIAITRGKRKVTALIDLRRRVKGTYVVRTVVVTKRLNIKTGTRRYRVCGG
jgi:hypothetical protein